MKSAGRFALVHLLGALSGADAADRLARLNSLRKRLLQESAASPVPSTPPPPRVGEIPKVIKVLDAAAEPLHTTEIHQAVERLLGRRVNYRSIKSCLSEGARMIQPRFERTAYGEYRLRSS